MRLCCCCSFIILLCYAPLKHFIPMCVCTTSWTHCGTVAPLSVDPHCCHCKWLVSLCCCKQQLLTVACLYVKIVTQPRGVRCCCHYLLTRLLILLQVFCASDFYISLRRLCALSQFILVFGLHCYNSPKCRAIFKCPI